MDSTVKHAPSAIGTREVVKAVVTESSSGEISCSIEETNRIRALLGLKPLSVGPSKETQAVQNFKRQKQEEAAVSEAQAIKDRLEKSKERRLLHAKSNAPTLGDINGQGDEELVSAADWVSRSRKVECLNKEKSLQAAAKATSKLDEGASTQVQTYRSEDLKGLGIQHAAKEFVAGEDVILTLADAPLLETDDTSHKVTGLRMIDDALENVNLAAEERRRDALRRIQRSKRPVYSGYDDDEFEETGEGWADGRPQSRRLLAQYDDAPAVPQTRLVLGEGGTALAGSATATKRTFAQPESHSLKTSNAEADAFYTQAEYAAFHKPKEKKLRKKRKMRVNDDAEEEGGGAAVLEAALAQQATAVETSADNWAEGEAGIDFGSRRTATTSIDSISVEMAKRRDAYEQAVLAAGRRSDLAFKRTGGEQPLVLEDAELLASIERAQRFQAHSVVSSDSRGALEDRGALWAREQVKIKQESERADVEACMDTQGSSEPDGKLIFTTTTAFASRIVAAAEAHSQLVPVDVKAANPAWVPVKTEKLEVDSEALDVQRQGVEGRPDSDTISDTTTRPFGLLELDAPSAVAGSMAATLALLKGTGDLKSTDSRLAGRSKDKREVDPSAQNFDVKLDYTDEFGRKLTQKEAFRQLTYAFHGIAPGLKAQEKRLKALEREAAQATSRDIDAGSMRNLLNAQKATGSAHVVLSGSGKTSKQNDDSVARLAQEIHEKRQARKDKEKS